MSDQPASDPMPEPGALPAAEQELEVDLAAFLPEGVQIGDPDVEVDDDGEVEVGLDVVETEIVTDDGVVVVEEIEVVVATDDEVVVIDEVLVDGVVVEEVVVEEAVVSAPEAERSSVDLEALSQIERDLDAVDAAIAALDAGTYGIDPTTGQPIDDALLAEDPTRLR